MFGKVTMKDFYWIDNNGISKLYFKDNSMPCAEICKPKGKNVYHSELWVYKIGRSYLNDEDEELIKFKTKVKAAQMINSMRDYLTNESHINNMRIMGSQNPKEILLLFYNDIIPKQAKEYFG